ncbi:cation diffusion facilitator family transporter [Microbacterium amylolyticum]|uniref:Cobalt-zinc-cadmium efflux system protein n=1 Tax=Microbacterium amylolyticum TaxID=936337 RepID=A0ABS4ZK29_9MICO|nr:cation diffusion facilitator family transporter [Microbacterium amylolyticum]MBP2437644.1 cobalt-zinc-cadmium efflux system protein [Microbacterium amylolyticum]
MAASPALSKRLAIAIGLVSTIVIAQLIGAIVTGSLAILVDAVHSITDSAGLVVAFIAARLMMRPPTTTRTWGFRRIEILAALAQAVFLIGAAAYAVVEGIDRWRNPHVVDASALLVFALASLTLNVVAALVLVGRRGANLNMRAAFLEVVMDGLGTVAVALSAILMMTTGFARADTIAALVIGALILPRAGLLFRDAVRVLMEFTPRGLDLEEVRTHIGAMPHVLDVHDLHASTVSTGMKTLSAHIVLDDECFHDGHAPETLESIGVCMADHFDIMHTTFQLETAAHRRDEEGGVIHP